MKKKLILLLCLSLVFILIGCSRENKEGINLNNENTAQSSKIEPNPYEEKDNDNVLKKTTKVNSKVKLHEGTYVDEKYYKEDLSKVKNYCEVEISNVTDTSFDFTVYEVDREKGTKKVIFLKNTADFIKYGSEAAFYGNDYTLNFTFPSVTDIKVSGFKPLEGITYINNEIKDRKLYEATYWDERCFGGDTILGVKNYCAVEISNVTDTSFDFTVYEINREKNTKKVILPKNTAIFEKEGNEAVFNGNDYTLKFTFPYITHIRISGFKPLEGRDYMNNRIPGHECS